MKIRYVQDILVRIDLVDFGVNYPFIHQFIQFNYHHNNSQVVDTEQVLYHNNKGNASFLSRNIVIGELKCCLASEDSRGIYRSVKLDAIDRNREQLGKLNGHDRVVLVGKDRKAGV
jgi:hypothetical protein